jgi:hypothetical protein
MYIVLGYKFEGWWQKSVEAKLAYSTPSKPSSQLTNILVNMSVYEMQGIGLFRAATAHSISLSDSIFNCTILIPMSSMQP